MATLNGRSWSAVLASRSLVGLALALGIAATAQAGPVSGQGTWETTLLARDIDGKPVALNDADAVFYYDTVLDLTWLRNWNANGLMTWASATAWAASLNVNGFEGWSLPGVLDIGGDGCNPSSAGGTDCGYNLYVNEAQRRSSPLAHMIYDTLGNLPYCPAGDTDCTPAPQDGWGLTNTGPFSNILARGYWTGSEYAPNDLFAWYFHTNFAYQDRVLKSDLSGVVAVRPGDVAIPEPGSLALLFAAFGRDGSCQASAAAAIARRDGANSFERTSDKVDHFRSGVAQQCVETKAA